MEEILASIKRVIAEDGRGDVGRLPRAAPDRRAEAGAGRGRRARARRSGDRGPGLLSDNVAAASRERLAASPRCASAATCRPIPARSTRSSARCCGRCSRTGSTSACPRSSRSWSPAKLPELPDAASRSGRACRSRLPAALGRRPMKKLLLASLAALALASAPAAFARPITATDLATMRRLARRPSRRTGNWAVYQLRETDLDGQSRPHRPVAAGPDPRRRRAGHGSPRTPSITSMTRAFRPTGAGSTISATPRAPTSSGAWRRRAARRSSVTDLADRHRRLPARTDRRPDRDLGRPRHGLHRLQLRQRAGAPGRARAAAGSMTRPSSATGTPGRSRACARASSPSRWSMAGRRARARRSRRTWSAIRRPSRSAAPRSSPGAPDGRTLYFTLREARPARAQLDQSRHLRGARRRQRARRPTSPPPMTAWTPRPAVSPDGRWLAYTAMARPTYEADRQVVQLRNLADRRDPRADPATGIVRSARSPGRRTAAACWSPPATRSTRRVFRVDVASGRVARLTQAGTAGNVAPLRDGSFLYTLNSLQAPDDLYRLDRRGAVDAGSPRSMPTSSPVSIRSTSQRFHFAGAAWRHGLGPDRQAGRRHRAGCRSPSADPWRAAKLVRQRLVLSLESVGVRRAGLCRGHRRFPRQHRLRPGLHRRDQPRLGRRAARGSAPRPRRRRPRGRAARHRQCLRARRLLWRLHGQLDRRQLAGRLQVPGQPFRRLRPARHGL